jgi:hypothetical protein
MFSQERDQLRQVFFNAWRNHIAHQPLEPMEAQVVDIILMHPEYHVYLANPDEYQTKDFPEGNPFLHMSLHISVREQVSTNRPAGISMLYEKLCCQFADAHIAEHHMQDCLAEILWQAHRDGVPPDEEKYLGKLQSC